MRLYICVTVAALFLVGATAEAGLARPWRLADAFAASILIIDDVQISPDGASVLVDTVHTDLKTNKFVSAYQLVRIADGSSRPMPEEFTHPRWSADGKTIAWISPTKIGTTRIVLTDANGANAKPLTEGKRTILRFAWSPIGSSIAAIEAVSNPTTSVARLHWMGASNDFLDKAPPPRQLWKIDTVTGRETLLVHDGWSFGGAARDSDPSFSADGKSIAAVRQPSAVFEDFDREEYVIVDVASGTMRPVIHHKFFAYPGSAAPLFSPRGNDVAYVQTWDGKLPSREDLFVGDRDVTRSIDRDLWSCGSGDFAWQPGTLIANMMDGTSLRLYRIDPSSGASRPLTSMDGSVEAFSVARTGRIAYAWTTPTQLPEVYVLDSGGAPRRVTHFGALPSDLPIEPTRYVRWSDGHGHILHGQLTFPASGDLKHLPIVMEPHGGPQCADDFSFDSVAQYLASNGYAYFRPDPRGSDGYGDWSYKAIVDDWGPGPMADDMAGINAVVAGGVGDLNHLYIEGASYGGYLTTWIVTHTNRFRAAVAAVPVTNMLLDYTLSEDSNITRRFFTAKPATVPQQLAAQSPLTYASAERTPLLVIIGLHDTRAPYPQAIEFYKAVLENGGTAKLLADPLAGHGPDDPQGNVAWYSATFGWLSQYGAPTIPDAVLPK